MQTEFLSPIQYYLVFEDSFLNVNQLIGKEISISFEGYQCLNCGKEKKIFRQGFCYDCFMSSPAAGDWIMKPELSTAHLDQEDRDLEYEKRVQLQPHIVYLANSSNVKVGVTRKSQVPTRWIDQGANAALIIAETPNRYTAGVIEVALKDFFVDKTNWQSMLKNIGDESIDLVEEKWMAHEQLPSDLAQYFTEDEEVLSLKYPVQNYPEQVQSMSFDKTAEISGELTGIRGQYLYLNGNQVLNIRRHTGYQIEFNY